MILATQGQLPRVLNRRRGDPWTIRKKDSQGAGGWTEAPYDDNGEEELLLENDGANG